MISQKQHDDAFRSGWRAGKRGLDEDDTPYLSGTVEHAIWNRWRLVSLATPHYRTHVNRNPRCAFRSGCLKKSKKGSLCIPCANRKRAGRPSTYAERAARASAWSKELWKDPEYRKKVLDALWVARYIYNAREPVRERARARMKTQNKDKAFIAKNRAAITASYKNPKRKADAAKRMTALNKDEKLNVKRRESRIAHGYEVSEKRRAGIANAIANSDQTYEQIATRRRVSMALVCRVAKDYNVQRGVAKRRKRK